MTTAKMTPGQATLFERYSSQNAAIVKNALPCGCEPYKDVFTYERWKAQGYQVQRGQHAIKIPVVVRVQDEETEEVHKRLFNGHVFCRHQVQPVGQKQTTPAPGASAAQVDALFNADAESRKRFEEDRQRKIEECRIFEEHARELEEQAKQADPADKVNDLMKGWHAL